MDNNLLTVWGEKLEDNNILPEYPRPQLVRDSYINLNGWYEYAITNFDKAPKSFDGKIRVPFSPECPLSGVNKTLLPHQYLWYRRTFTIPKGFNKGIVLLNFGAVDQACSVFVNKQYIGANTGGFLPFSLDITNALEENQNELVICVRDFTDTSYYSRGKQRLSRGGIWYSPQSGIWQTVWLESVHKEYIRGIQITPLFDSSAVKIRTEHNCASPLSVEIYRNQGLVAKAECMQEITVSLKDFKPWTPEEPFLYTVKVQSAHDAVQSYFGMRKVSIETVEGIKRIMLNNRPYFNSGLLDQGYYCDGYLTPPSDEAMINDIMTAKAMGFNMLRKHIKIEPLRWYYHCDKLGMLVWQDMVNGGGYYDAAAVQILPFMGIKLNDNKYTRFSRENKAGRDMFYEETARTIRLLYNSPSIIMWVPFNEGWGQFDAKKVYDFVKAFDCTRLVDHASGWHDRGGGDFLSRHIYFVKARYKKDKHNRPFIISEFGGYSFYVKDHSFSNKTFGYRKFKTAAALNSAFTKLYEKQIIPLINKGLCAAVYTQLTDVEDEANGILTYDRKVNKLDIEKALELNKRCMEANSLQE